MRAVKREQTEAPPNSDCPLNVEKDTAAGVMLSFGEKLMSF